MTVGYSNARFLYYINEIRSAVMIMHGEKAHSRYFGEAAYKYMVEGKAEGYNFIGKPNPVPENKQLLIIPNASHCDLYDGGYTELTGKRAKGYDSLEQTGCFLSYEFEIGIDINHPKKHLPNRADLGDVSLFLLQRL